jgi:hypothetical protein
MPTCCARCARRIERVLLQRVRATAAVLRAGYINDAQTGDATEVETEFPSSPTPRLH